MPFLGKFYHFKTSETRRQNRKKIVALAQLNTKGNSQSTQKQASHRGSIKVKKPVVREGIDHKVIKLAHVTPQTGVEQSKLLMHRWSNRQFIWKENHSKQEHFPKFFPVPKQAVRPLLQFNSLITLLCTCSSGLLLYAL